jgi:superfamily II DNA/RNA helicase
VNNSLAGIDIPNVDYVFNLNLKKKFQYLRNASHAGRGNRNGKVLSFVNEEYT